MIRNNFQMHPVKPPQGMHMVQDAPSESDYYKGASGSRYFDWQNQNAKFTGQLEARKFHDYIKPTDAILDFGCGGGHILQSLTCARRVGVDVNPAARAAARHAGVECYDSVGEVDNHSFNIVISNHALEHVEHPIAILRALRQKLLPSGKLVLCLPLDDWRTQRVYDPEDVNHHLQAWTPQLLGNSLFEAGFLAHQFSIRILTYAFFPRFGSLYGKLPEALFDRLCQIFAVIVKRRQLLAVATG